MDELISKKYIPSFCTACYRLGRTGEHFMEFSVPGFIKRYCQPNALMTLVEYLEDYAPADTKAKGYHLVQAKLDQIEDAAFRENLTAKIEELKNGKRDLYF